MLDRPFISQENHLHASQWSFERASDLISVMGPLHAHLGTLDITEAESDFRIDVDLSWNQGLAAVGFATRSRVRFLRHIYSESQIEIHFVESGRHRVDINGSQFVAPAGYAYAILQPGRIEVDIDASSSGTAIALSRQWCTALASHGSGDPTTVLSSFKPMVHFTEGGTEALRHMARILTVGGPNHVFAASPPGACAFKDALLLTFMSSWPSEAPLQQPQLFPGNLKRALIWLDENLHQDFSMETLAAAGTSVRTLQMYFRQYLHNPPRVFVTRLRLEKVRQDLLACGSSEKVSDIASRWGFNHMGNFASLYKDTYGEAPSATRAKGSGLRKSIS